MTWRLAHSLTILRAEVDLLRPNRSKASDGSIGNEEHATRDSDHNPWVIDSAGAGVVTAIDITDDLGTLTKALWGHLLGSRDDRLKYVIGEGEFFSSYATSTRQAWQIAPYSGPNGHFSHLHVSVQPAPQLYDSERTWGLSKMEDDLTDDERKKLDATHLLATAAADGVAELKALLVPLLKDRGDVEYARLQGLMRRNVRLASDADALAQKIVAALPSGKATTTQIEAAIRTVFGSLDD